MDGKDVSSGCLLVAAPLKLCAGQRWPVRGAPTRPRVTHTPTSPRSPQSHPGLTRAGPAFLPGSAARGQSPARAWPGAVGAGRVHRERGRMRDAGCRRCSQWRRGKMGWCHGNSQWRREAGRPAAAGIRAPARSGVRARAPVGRGANPCGRGGASCPPTGRGRAQRPGGLASQPGYCSRAVRGQGAGVAGRGAPQRWEGPARGSAGAAPGSPARGGRGDGWSAPSPPPCRTARLDPL